VEPVVGVGVEQVVCSKVFQQLVLKIIQLQWVEVALVLHHQEVERSFQITEKD
jgi:hypothetical protein